MGMIKTKINIQRNFGNQLTRYVLQELDRNIAYQTISSGQVNTLVGGDLTLDLSDARVLFNQGRTEGAAHVQFLAFEHIGEKLWPTAMPLWLYGIQPKGIQVEGDVNLTLKIPALAGSYNYFNPEGYPYVILLGFNAEQQVVEPIGVGKIANNQVSSEGVLHLTSLDYVGYAQVHPDLADKLVGYAEGELSLQALKAHLQAPIQQASQINE
jgi:hypothetical protein